MIDVVIVGDGPVVALVEQTPALALCAVIDGDPAIEAAAAYPSAAFVIAALPRTGAAAVEAIAALGRRAIVIPPTAATAARHPAIRVAPLTVGQTLAIDPAWTALTIDVGGLELDDEPRALWWHAIAIARSVGLVVVRDVALPAGRVDLALDGRPITLTVAASRAITTIAWPGGELRLARRPSYLERALAALGDPRGTIDLDAAAQIDALVDQVLPAAPSRPTAGARALARSARTLATAVTDHERRAAFGLVGDAALDAAAPRADLRDLLGDASIEAWGFRAGVKPVAFVTVAPEREAATIAQFAGAHVERRERNVAIGPQDRWDDDRRRGAPHVELYLARDAALAHRAAALQAEPTRNLVELGALLGYPPCCVAAFAAQRDRANNTLNRYLAAARTPPGAAPWPWPLADLHAKLVAFYPCSYRCDAALAIATATVATVEAARPGTTARLEALLARRVLYLDHAHQRWLADDEDVALTDDRLELRRADGSRARFERRDPGLGFVAGFG